MTDIMTYTYYSCGLCETGHSLVDGSERAGLHGAGRRVDHDVGAECPGERHSGDTCSHARLLNG